MNNKLILIFIAAILITPVTEAKKKLEKFKPYRLLSPTEVTFDVAVSETRQLLEKSNFELVGEYSPYSGAHIFAITHEALLNAASEGEHGGYGAVIRVSVTETENNVQVSYVNPTYMTNLYHIPEVPDVTNLLEATFGKSKGYGSKKGKSRKALKGYQYMMFMPEFEDHDKLGSFASYQAAIEAINGKLSSAELPLKKIFEVKIPGKDETLFGIAINEGDGADSHIMKIIDNGEVRHTAHLPYAVLVSGETAYALAGKFRIASAFPDLTMGTFMEISDAPDAIKNSLAKLAK